MEKEALNIELNDCKAKLLNIEEKEKRWKKDGKLLVENEKDLKANMAAKEKELQEKSERIKNQSTVLSAEVDTTSLS